VVSCIVWICLSAAIQTMQQREAMEAGTQ